MMGSGGRKLLQGNRFLAPLAEPLVVPAESQPMVGRRLKQVGRLCLAAGQLMRPCLANIHLYCPSADPPLLLSPSPLLPSRHRPPPRPRCPAD